MKSFTAHTHLGNVRVRLPDDEPPSVWQGGHQIAKGTPISAEGPSLVFNHLPEEDGGQLLTCTPTGTRETRQAISITRSGITVVYDDKLPVTHITACFAAEGLPVLWGARLGPKEATVRGFTFDDGEQILEEWAIDLVPIKRKRCCGGGR